LPKGKIKTQEQRRKKMSKIFKIMAIIMAVFYALLLAVLLATAPLKDFLLIFGGVTVLVTGLQTLGMVRG
jgi:preprotein translocase subunit SecY